MSSKRFILLFVLMLLMQLVLTKCCQIGPFLCISLLPAMVFCIPPSTRTELTMIVAFVSGLLVDALAEGPLGLNAAALVPCALVQKPIIRILIDNELVERGYTFSFHQYGYLKVGLALLVEIVLFFTIYVIFDSAGERSGLFNFTKILVSSAVSFIFGMIATGVLSPRQKR